MGVIHPSSVGFRRLRAPSSSSVSYGVPFSADFSLTCYLITTEGFFLLLPSICICIWWYSECNEDDRIKQKWGRMWDWNRSFFSAECRLLLLLFQFDELTLYITFKVSIIYKGPLRKITLHLKIKLLKCLNETQHPILCEKHDLYSFIQYLTWTDFHISPLLTWKKAIKNVLSSMRMKTSGCLICTGEFICKSHTICRRYPLLFRAHKFN